MKKRFLLFPIVALLATGCAGGGYNTSTKLPAGGKAVSEEEQAEVTSDIFGSLTKFFSEDESVLATLPDITGFTVNASLDAHVKYDSDYSDENGFVNRTHVKADTTGKATVAYYVNTAAPDPEATFNVGSAAKLEIEDFSFKMSFSSYEKIKYEEEWQTNETNFKFDFSDLDLGVYYVFDTVSNDGYILADLSSSALPELVNQILEANIKDAEKLAYAKTEIGKLLKSNQKVYFSQSSLVAMLDAYIDSLEESEKGSFATLIETIHPMLEGDIFTYVHDHSHELLNTLLGEASMPISIDSLIPTIQAMLPMLNPTLVSYGTAEEGAYGLGLHVSNSSLKKVLGVDLKKVAGISIDAGLALVIGNRNGLGEGFLAPELLEVKASVSAEAIKVNAGVSVDFLFNAQSPFVGVTKEFKDSFAKNGMDLINALISMFRS